MTNSNLEKGIPWRFGPDWPGQRCGAKTRRARPARGRRTSAMDAAPCMVADPQDRRRRMAWRGLQRLVRPMVNTPKRSGQRPSVLQNRGARCEPSWLSWRHGSWTTVIWTRTGGIGSNRRYDFACRGYLQGLGEVPSNGFKVFISNKLIVFL